jgi:hypothetical protein
MHNFTHPTCNVIDDNSAPEVNQLRQLQPTEILAWCLFGFALLLFVAAVLAILLGYFVAAIAILPVAMIVAIKLAGLVGGVMCVLAVLTENCVPEDRNPFPFSWMADILYDCFSSLGRYLCCCLADYHSIDDKDKHEDHQSKNSPYEQVEGLSDIDMLLSM